MDAKAGWQGLNPSHEECPCWEKAQHEQTLTPSPSKPHGMLPGFLSWYPAGLLHLAALQACQLE